MGLDKFKDRFPTDNVNLAYYLSLLGLWTHMFYTYTGFSLSQLQSSFSNFLTILYSLKGYILSNPFEIVYHGSYMFFFVVFVFAAFYKYERGDFS